MATANRIRIKGIKKMPTGVYPRTKEHRKKIGKSVSKALKGNPKICGKNNVSKRLEVRVKIREAKKRNWQDPEYRKKQTNVIKKGQNYPEVKKRQRETTKKLWQDPEYRRKHIEAMHRPEVSMKRSGKNNPKWRGGKESYWRSLGKKVWEEHHGRKIPKGHVIHHKDGNYKNIDPKNLELIASRGRHVTWHAQLRRLKERTKKFLEGGLNA